MVGVPAMSVVPLMALIPYYLPRQSFAQRLDHLRVEHGDGVEHRLDLETDRVALRQKALDVRLETLLLVEQAPELAADRVELALERLLLLTKRLRQLDGAV